MAVINLETRHIVAKVVYYAPKGSGKTATVKPDRMGATIELCEECVEEVEKDLSHLSVIEKHARSSRR